MQYGAHADCSLRRAPRPWTKKPNDGSKRATWCCTHTERCEHNRFKLSPKRFDKICYTSLSLSQPCELFLEATSAPFSLTALLESLKDIENGFSINQAIQWLSNMLSKRNLSIESPNNAIFFLILTLLGGSSFTPKNGLSRPRIIFLQKPICWARFGSQVLSPATSPGR